jgi:hypothetical protein
MGDFLPMEMKALYSSDYGCLKATEDEEGTSNQVAFL